MRRVTDLNAGLPGTGIGGLFYIVSALWMPAHRALNGGTHDGRNWRRAGGQAAMAAGVLIALFATGWLLGLMITPDVGAGGFGAAPREMHSVIRWAAVLGTAGLLIGVLLAVEALHLYMQARARRTTPGRLRLAKVRSRK